MHYLIVGLGNIGDEYANTRHNIGFRVVDKLAKDANATWEDKRYGFVTTIRVKNRLLTLLKPSTYMNLSGNAVGKAAKFYKIEPQNITVVYDDISLDVGKMRIRKKGSAGGHNGIKSIIENLGTDEFPRIKIGVGKKPHPEMDLADWVLSNFTKDEQDSLSKMFDSVADALTLMNKGETDKAMNNFNS